MSERDELLFLPLGGAGEIGMNLNLYGYGGRWLMVDLGVTFGDAFMPGVDVVMPDIDFIEGRRKDLAGLVLTHAHEDHIGAVPYLWPYLRCPVYATPFTAAVLRRKLAAADMLDQVPLTEVPLSGRFQLPPFDIELITMTHSIPEPNALVLRTPLGTVLHTGDWKLDPEPLVGDIADADALRRVGEEGVLALVGDSTNAMVAGESGSESAVREALSELVGRFDKRVAIGCFATNVARLETIAAVAKAHDRQAALVGRSLWRVYEAACETGYLSPDLGFLDDRAAAQMPRERLLLACTGSQGEPRAALSRIAAGDHPFIGFDPGDAVIFSSRIIPGNERAIFHLQNQLTRLGVAVITERDRFVHVSGHPARDELAAMYQWVRPQIAIPVHGELRHLTAHAALAKECQVPQAIVAENGSMIRLAPGPAAVVDHVPTGRLALDGDDLLPLDSPILRERKRMLYHGAAVATVALDGRGQLRGKPELTLYGVYDMEEDDAAVAALSEAVAEAVAGLSPAARADDAQVREAVRLAVRRAIAEERGIKPVTTVHLVRLPGSGRRAAGAA